MNSYQVFVWANDTYNHTLEDVDPEGLKRFLSTYKGFVGDLTIIEGRVMDNVSLLKDLGVATSFGKVKK